MGGRTGKYGRPQGLQARAILDRLTGYSGEGNAVPTIKVGSLRRRRKKESLIQKKKMARQSHNCDSVQSHRYNSHTGRDNHSSLANLLSGGPRSMPHIPTIIRWQAVAVAKVVRPHDPVFLAWRLENVSLTSLASDWCCV